ncbi:MAG: 3-hydroxybutyryl-CoA dehydrogenase [Elusimicrobia bacterium]|nr:3-hydroxybutyryl-CoA dehydrogenase [Elusimicrobiota bacterium]
MAIKKLGVVGAGTMGRGIVQVAAEAGYETVVYDLSRDILDRALSEIHRRLLRLEEKGKLKQGDAVKALGRIHPTSDWADFKNCDFVVEAVAEELGAKQGVFRNLEAAVSASAVLASNTSSISIDAIASACKNPDRVVGMHYFNPVPVMKLIEIIKGRATSDLALETARTLARSLRKTIVEAKDAPGFIVNRILRPYFIEPLRLIEQGLADIESVDAALRSMGYPMGPFQLADFIGLDVNLAITKVVYDALGKPERLKPSAVQETLVKEGCLGRKNGRGYYLYDGQQVIGPNPRLSDVCPSPSGRSSREETAWRVLKAQIAEAEILINDGIATAEHIDLAMRLGTNSPRGPFEWKAELHAKA